jgi:hypothetical protein
MLLELNLIESISVIGLLIAIGLILALLYIYVRNYRVVRIHYGLLLVLLTSLLLLYNIFEITEVWFNLESRLVDIIMLCETIIEIIILSIVLKITLNH